ncbi:MAG: tRNA(Ile)-lysidine synthetase [Naasia sp.]|jgi:tRNA(Ile)-lysidine synthase|uniref:tRNA lysidine(34) synthetase TilS n=1 Tax=Naasia sp. TaxID=2546198 RepID=UPI002618BB27|nr:tRNA lysidine(34) synthetase TilS [Naasia sp.]MCU1571196.1 tRNA(Ile)-lysidine synthetase [Naasia sp.]
MPSRPRLTPAVADLRRAVRDSLALLGPGDDRLILVALSGGPDSLALAAAAAFEAPRAGLRVGAVVVDHGLQDGSAEVARRASEQAVQLGLHPVLVRRVSVTGEGGPEAAARAARYAALDAAVAETGAVRVLLGHTRDDQAETVLLGLARGSGPDSLSGMRADSAPYLRPLLDVPRATTAAACTDSGLTPWHDPQNLDPRFRRVRVRNQVLPVLERELGPGVAEALARTAEQLREDAAALDAMAEEWVEEIAEHAEAGIALPVAALASNPAALRQRVIRLAVEGEFGLTPSRAQTLAVARLVTDWHGQGPVDLPGVRVERRDGMLRFSAAAPSA